MADSTPNGGEAPVIVGMADAAMHMCSAAIDTLPDAHDSEFPHRAGIELIETAAHGPGATLGQRLYVARGHAKLSNKEAANGKDLIAVLGG